MLPRNSPTCSIGLDIFGRALTSAFTRHNPRLVGTQESALAVYHALCAFRIASSLHLNLQRDFVELANVTGSKFDGSRPNVLFEAMQLRCAGNRNQPRVLGENPRKRDLSRCRLLLLRELAEHIN